jgi:putative acetyltransferase
MIRPYCKSDLEAVALLFTDSVHHVANRYYDSDQLAAWAPRPPDLNSWTARLASVETLVAETDGKLAGFISYELNGHIDLLYTSPVECRRGVASALLRQAEAAIAGRGVSELFTEASLAARAFFERFGFKVSEEQCVQRNGVTFRRYAMRKPLIAQQAFQATRSMQRAREGWR